MPLGLLVDLAVDRGRALAGAARIEGDDVEAVVEGAEQVDADRLRVVDGVAARPAGVDEQRADAIRLILRGQPRDGDLGEAGARMVVVERRLVGRALPSGSGRIGVRRTAPTRGRPAGCSAIAGATATSRPITASAATSARGTNRRRTIMCPPRSRRAMRREISERRLCTLYMQRNAYVDGPPQPSEGRKSAEECGNRPKPVASARELPGRRRRRRPGTAGLRWPTR